MQGKTTCKQKSNFIYCLTLSCGEKSDDCINHLLQNTRQQPRQGIVNTQKRRKGGTWLQMWKQQLEFSKRDCPAPFCQSPVSAESMGTWKEPFESWCVAQLPMLMSRGGNLDSCVSETTERHFSALSSSVSPFQLTEPR